MLGAIAAQLALPFVVMGDWNMEPKFLAQTGWLEQNGGYVAAPDQPTCWCGDNESGSIIDYSILSNSLSQSLRDIQFERDDPYQPHRYVKFNIDGKITNTSEFCVDQPAGFPIDKPIGPPINNTHIWTHKWDSRACIDQHAE